MDLKTTFPTAAVNASDGKKPLEQRFPVGEKTVTIVTFTTPGGGSLHAGIIVEQQASDGYFQRRGYVGNSLNGKVIDPVTVTPGTYDLTLDGNVVASFFYRPGQGWSKIK